MLEWWETEGRDAGVQLVVMSDHGHGVVRRHFDMKGILEKAGLSILMGREVLEGADTASADAVLVGTYWRGTLVHESRGPPRFSFAPATRS